MTREQKIAAMDAIVRDLFARGGPQRPTNLGTGKYLRPSVLEIEQMRLLKTWREGK